MHTIYRRLRLRQEQEGFIYLQFSLAIFNVQSGLRDKRSPFEKRNIKYQGMSICASSYLNTIDYRAGLRCVSKLDADLAANQEYPFLWARI
jgi:hypothetical protein